MLVLIAIALIAGAATVLAPCVLPVLPAVIAAGGGGAQRPIGIGVGVIASFTIFTLGLASGLRAVGLSPDTLRTLAIIALVVMGLVVMLPWLDARLARAIGPFAGLSQRLPRGGDGLGGGILLGVALGLAWTPCAGPILAAISATVATTGAGVDVGLVLLAYAIGAAVPLVLIAWGGRRLLGRVGAAAGPLRQGMGALMVLAALAMWAGLDTRLTAAALADVPGYQSTIQVLEDSDLARDRLADLQGIARDAPLEQAVRGNTPSAADELGLPNAGPAPELIGISDWFNGPPLRLDELRGRVVLVDFWTYSCVNCVRTLPHLRAWDRAYRDDGLVIIGVHTPEFAFEAEPDNVAQAIDDLSVTWPVALDPDFATWRAYGNRYWPAKYLIDRNGDVRDLHIGEGGYERTEELIRRLLEVPPRRAEQSARIGDDSPSAHNVEQTPESYLGHQRIARFGGGQVARDRVAEYRAPFRLGIDQLAFDGSARVAGEYVEAGPGGAEIHLNYRAADVFLVMESTVGPADVSVRVDGRAPSRAASGDDVASGVVRVAESRLYSLVRDRSGADRHRLVVGLPEGVRAFAFTFG